MAREAGSDARARKRERDKQNQRQRRRRERDAFEELQQRNELLEQQVRALSGGNAPDVQRLSDKVQSLQKLNTELKERMELADAFVRTWNTTKEPTVQFCAATTSSMSGKEHGNGLPPSQVTSPALSTPLVSGPPPFPVVEPYTVRRASSIPSDWSGSIASPVVERTDGNMSKIGVYEERLAHLLDSPPWKRLPLNLRMVGGHFQPAFDPFTIVIEKLRASGKIFEACVPCPRAFDLVYGDSQNELANAIASITYPNPSRRTEKLAYQWYCYMLARWMVQPTQESFSRIPPMLRPTARQLCVPHAPIFDYIAWPHMRDNFIETGTKYCRPEVFGLLFVTCRLRETPNADYIVQDEHNQPQIDPVFLAKLSSLDSWVLLDRFWTDYPELVKGMDPSKFMISEDDLV